MNASELFSIFFADDVLNSLDRHEVYVQQRLEDMEEPTGYKS